MASATAAVRSPGRSPPLKTDVPHVCLLGPSSEDIADRYDALLAALAGAGAHVSVVSDGEVRGTGIDASQFPPALARGSLGSAALVPLLVARWSARPPTILHVLDPRLGPAAAAAAAVVGVPVQLWTLPRTFEGGSRHRRRLVGARNRLAAARLRGASKAVNRFVALHAGAQRSWTALGIARPDVTTLLDSGMGVPVEELLDHQAGWRESSRRVWGVGDDTPVVGYVADERALADPVEVAAIFKRIRQTGAAAECRFAVPGVVAPDGADALSDSTARRRWLAGLDLVLSVGRSIEQAVPVQEAAALSVPAVVSDSPGHVEVVRHGHTGLVTPRGDLGAAADACASLVGDADARRALGARARSYAARLHDRDLAVQKVLRVYDQLLGGPQPEPARLTADGRLVSESGRDLVDR